MIPLWFLSSVECAVIFCIHFVCYYCFTEKKTKRKKYLVVWNKSEDGVVSKN